jgi:gliding motility-associated-like protein
MRLALLTLFTALLGFSTAAQTASPLIGCAPLEVNFSPPDGGQAFWNFDDGASSSLSSPSHVFTGPGVFNVTFSRTNGGPVVGTVTVTVFARPTVTLTVDDTEGCIPHSVQFEATTNLDPSIALNEINWSFGDGGSATGPITNNTYQQAGTFDVAVQLVTDIPTCNTTVIFADTVTALALPNVRFATSPNPPQSCDIPLDVGLTNRTTGVEPLSYVWDFGNGTGSTLEEPGTAFYGNAGAFTLSLEATDANGCQSSTSRLVSAGPPSPAFNLPDTVCFGDTFVLSAVAAADTYDWTFGPGIDLLEDLNSTQVVVFTTAGFTTVGLAVENLTQGCSNDTTRNVFVQQLIADLASDPLSSCSTPYSINYRVNNVGLSALWTFAFGQGQSTSLDTTITFDYDEGGEFGYNALENVRALVTLTSPQGCTVTERVTNFIDIPNALFIPDIHNGCAPLTVTFADSIRSTAAVTSVTIDWGDGIVEDVANVGPWPHTYTSPGEFEAFILMENALGCRDTSYSIPIQVGEPIGNLTFTSDVSPACPGDTLTFINTTTDPRIDNVHFQAEGGSSFHCGGNDTLFHVLTNTIEGADIDLTFFVEYNGCIDSLTETFPYTSAPRAQFNYKVECETPFDVRFFNENTRSTADSLYVFSDSVGVFRDSFAIVDSLDITLPSRGVYQAVIVAIDPGSPCGSDRDTIEFFITQPIARFDLDTLFCSGAVLPLDGSSSQDVNATCSKGYQWEFSFDRPYTSERSTTGMDVLTGARGDQTVSLIVEDINGCTDTVTNPIRVFQTDLTITASQSRICLPSTVDFNLAVDADTTIVTYAWDFGGFGTSAVQNPSFTFPFDADVGDEITVTVMTTDELGCVGNAEFVLSVYRPISEVLTVPEAPIICAGQSIDFAASDFTSEGSFLQFMWDFDNGFTSQNRIESTTYLNSGTFNVTLDYTEVATGCAGDTTIIVMVQEAPTANFTSDIDGQAVVCFPQIVNFTDASTSTSPFTPIFQVGTQLAVGQTFTSALDRGTSEVSLIAITSAGCADTVTREFTLVGPEGGFTFDPGIICQGETVDFMLRDTVDLESWTWDFGDGTTEENTNPTSHVYNTAPAGDQTIVSLTLRNAGGECTFVVTDTLRFFEINANFSTDLGSDFACDPTVQFVDQSSGATSYFYDFGNGNTSTDPNPTFTFSGPGSFNITLSIGNDIGCTDTMTRTIVVLDPLELDVDLDLDCSVQSTDITVTAGRPLATVLFDPPGLIASQTGNVFSTVSLAEPTSITITAIDSFGCEVVSAAQELQIGPMFESDLLDTFFVLSGSDFTIDIDQQDGFDITFDDPDITFPNPTVTNVENNTQVQISVFNEVCDQTTQIIIQIIVFDEPIIPNLFTPNGDGTNDDWGPLFPEGFLPTVEVYQVYNRFGALVFESDDPTEKWIGDSKGGDDAPSDVYAYAIKFRFPNGDEFNSSGEVTLLR